MEDLRATLSDLVGSIGRWHLWTMLAWEDIRQRYRGSLLGPAWLTIGMAVTSAGLAFLFGSLFGQPWTETVSYISCGIMMWTFITTCLNDGCFAFLGAGGIIRNVSLPYAIHVWRVLLRNIIIMLHSLPVVILFLFIAKVKLSPNMLLIVPGFILVCIWLVAAIYALAAMASRFRDVPQVVTYCLQFAMFVTPVFWRVNQMGGKRALIVHLNPLAHLMSIVRDPLLGVAPAPNTWVAAILVTLVTIVFALVIASASRKRIALWI